MNKFKELIIYTLYDNRIYYFKTRVYVPDFTLCILTVEIMISHETWTGAPNLLTLF